MEKKNKIIIAIFLIFVFIVTGFIIIASYKSTTKGQQGSQKPVYYCLMHPTYTSDRPGDCPICNMKLVKKQPQAQAQTAQALPAQTPESVVGKEKTLEEVCIEHKCTMNNCPMTIKANLKPGERLICPLCGEVIGMESGKVIEIAKAKKPTSSETQVVKKERKILYYRNPMNPQVTSPVPMKDSMGMDYVPVYEEEGQSSSPAISISPEKQQLIGIITQSLKKMNLTKIIRASGKIAYDPDLYVAQEEYLQALKTVKATKESVLKSVIEQSNSLLAAAEKKLLLLGMNKAEIEELAKKGTAEENLYLPTGENSVWAYVAIYEYEIGLVKVGEPVEIEAVAYPGETFTGKVVAINPVLDAQTRTNQVRINLDNTAGKLKPEMFINAKIKVDLGEKLAVPDTAVLDTGVRKIVYLSRPGDLLEAREVKLGQSAEGYDEVLEGLQEGDIVVTSGNFLVDSESKLKSPSPESEHQHGQ